MTYLTTTIPQTREKGGNKLKGEKRKGQKIREAGEKGGKKDGNVKFNCLFLYPPQSKSISQMLHAQIKWYFEAAHSDYSL